MKNAREPERRRVFTLGQWRRGAPGIKRRCERQHNAPAPSAALPERDRLGHTLGAVLALALLLFAALGMGAAITGASARTPQHLSASSAAARPTKTPPPRHSPTPTTVPSPTATAPAPSPTLTALPTTRATVPARATPPVKATTPSVDRQAGGSQRRSHSTLPTRSPTVQHPSRVQQEGEGAFSPLVPGILSGIAAVGLLVAVGCWLLRKWLLPVRKVKLPPSGAAPWQRVRPTSLQSSMDSAGSSRQQLPMTDAFIPAASINLPSLSPTTSQGVPQWQARLSTRHLFEANEVESNPYERHASSSHERQFDPSQAKRPANGTHA